MILTILRSGGILGLLLLAAVLSPLRADAATTGPKWAFVGYTKYRDALFIDLNRLTCEANQRRQAWSRITPAEQSGYLRQIRRDLKKVKKKPDEFRYVEVLKEIGCRNRQIRHLRVVYFRPDGSVIHATRDDGPAWKSVHAGSLWDSLLTTVCEKHGCR